jgi:hypothetical protein
MELKSVYLQLVESIQKTKFSYFKGEKLKNRSKFCQIFANPVQLCAFCVKSCTKPRKKFSAIKTLRHEVKLGKMGKTVNYEAHKKARRKF